jgi:hypothetical protein
MMDLLLAFMVLGWPLVVLGLFTLLGVVVVTIAWRVGRSEGRRWGRWMAFWFLLFAFWDTPLVLGYFGYKCWSEGGFHEYKTVEQWKAENPGVAETLVPSSDQEWRRAKDPMMNQRFRLVERDSTNLLGVKRSEDRIVDVAKDEVVARHVDFRTFEHSNEPRFASPRTYKFWLNWASCETDGWSERILFNDYVYAIRQLGRESHGRE